MTTDEINNTINANKHNPEVITDDISDGFHTFGQLYFQRMMLFATLVNLFPELSWKTKRHEDGEECFGGGWFLVTIDTPAGPYGYHYRLEDWDKFNCMELKYAKHWDGYTEENVDRLFSLVDYKKYIQKISGFVMKQSERAKMFGSIKEETACKEIKNVTFTGASLMPDGSIEMDGIIDGMETIGKFKSTSEETIRRSCSECKQIDTCKDKIDARNIEDDIKYCMSIPNYIPGPNAECLVEGGNK